MKPFLTLLLFSLSCLTLQALANTQGEYKKQVTQLGKEIKKISRNLNANKRLLKTEQHKLLEAEQKIAELDKQSAEIALKIAKQQKAIQKINQQIQTAQNAQAADIDSVETLMLKQYMDGRPNYIQMLLNQQNPYAVGRLSHYYHYYQQAYTKKIAKLSDKVLVLKQLQDKNATAIATLSDIKQRQLEKQQELGLFKKERKKIITRLDKKVEKSSSKLKKLKQNRDRLNTLLKKIAEQTAAMQRLQQQQIEQQKQPSKKPSKTKPKTILKPVKGGFKKQKGRLKLPVKGKTQYRFGSRIAASGMLAEGMLIDTKPNQTVHSIFRGRVVFADWLKGYGLLMIIDHGDDHISLYGHNQLLYKKVGDMVEINEIIAKSGVTGGLKSPGVYFEIRHHATPINPSLWCK